MESESGHLGVSWIPQVVPACRTVAASCIALTAFNLLATYSPNMFKLLTITNLCPLEPTVGTLSEVVDAMVAVVTQGLDPDGVEDGPQLVGHVGNVPSFVGAIIAHEGEVGLLAH